MLIPWIYIWQWLKCEKNIDQGLEGGLQDEILVHQFKTMIVSAGYDALLSTKTYSNWWSMIQNRMMLLAAVKLLPLPQAAPCTKSPVNHQDTHSLQRRHWKLCYISVCRSWDHSQHFDLHYLSLSSPPWCPREAAVWDWWLLWWQTSEFDHNIIGAYNLHVHWSHTYIL